MNSVTEFVRHLTELRIYAQTRHISLEGILQALTDETETVRKMIREHHEKQQAKAAAKTPIAAEWKTGETTTPPTNEWQ